MEKHITCTLAVDIHHDTVDHVLEIIRAKLREVEPDPEIESTISVTIDKAARVLSQPTPYDSGSLGREHHQSKMNSWGLQGVYMKRPDGDRGPITESVRGDRDVLS